MGSILDEIKAKAAAERKASEEAKAKEIKLLAEKAEQERLRKVEEAKRIEEERQRRVAEELRQREAKAKADTERQVQNLKRLETSYCAYSVALDNLRELRERYVGNELIHFYADGGVACIDKAIEAIGGMFQCVDIEIQGAAANPDYKIKNVTN